jgi:glutathione S-transferase
MTTLKLYYAPRTRSTRPRWLLEELEVPYELARVDLSLGQHKQPGYLAVHPLGVVPALVDGGRTFIESTAICLYLADKYIEKGFAPPLGSADRGTYYQWMVYAHATLESAFLRHGDAKAAGVGLEEAEKRLSAALDPIARAVEGQDFLVGGKMTAADCVYGSMLAWLQMMNLADSHPGLKEYAKKLRARPAFRRAIAD